MKLYIYRRLASPLNFFPEAYVYYRKKCKSSFLGGGRRKIFRDLSIHYYFCNHYSFARSTADLIAADLIAPRDAVAAWTARRDIILEDR